MPSVIPRVLTGAEESGRVRENCDYKWAVTEKCNIAGFEDGGSGLRFRKANGP